MEHERQQKAFEDEIERLETEAHHQISETQRNYVDTHWRLVLYQFFISIICALVCETI